MKTPILGSSYVLRSPNAADSRMVNLFPEIVPEAGKESAWLQRAPGLRLLNTIGTGPIRGLWTFNGKGYVVSGNALYQIDDNWVATLKGSIAGSGQVNMTDNGTQMFIAAGLFGYIYNSNTDALTALTSPFAGAVGCGFIDGWFVFNQPNSQIFWVMDSTGTSIDPLYFASAEGSPDNLVTLIIDHREIWLFGTNSIEVWYNAGLPDFPLARIQGAFNEIGCLAAYSVAKLDNGLFWLGADARGNGIVYRSKGYSGERVSTHAVEWQIQQYSTLSDAVGYTYQQDGHSFYVLNFPTANTTWVYDVATGVWHERAGWNQGQFTRHRGNCQMNFSGEIVIGDYLNGAIYAYDPTVYTEAGDVQKWLRSWRALPTGENNLNRTVQHSLQLDCQAGVGLDGGVQGSDPQVMLRWSDDGGHTWSSEHWKSMGKMGQTGYRTIWRRLGMTLKLRDRVYEVSGTDPVKIAIMGAELHLGPTNA